jgi:penicillin amidase
MNALLVSAAVIVLGAAWWFLWRPVPQTSGRLTAAVRAEVRVERDERGVPHITAQSLDDLFFAQGYVTAQDRLWQLDSIRRLARGELSEVAGKVALESDTKARKLRIWRIAESSVAKLNAQERALLGAYARGVNAYIDEHRGRLSPEFRILGYEPRPWRMADTLVVGLEMFRTLTTTWDDDLLRYNLMQGGDPEKVRALFPARSGKEILPGSNAWVVSGRHTASGQPILANDPHLPFTLPSTWHMVHLKAPGLNVVGATLPGVPGVLSGHNEHIAWGITNLGFDVQDLYAEQIDLRSGRYVHKGEVKQAALESEWIAVKGQRPVRLASWLTVHGPVFTNSGAQNFALKWSAAEYGISASFVLDLNRAKNWEEFRAALRQMTGPGQNFVYADRAGNIGYQATGWLPGRRGFDGSLPLDGVQGEQEWEGVTPFEQMPSAFNPPSGRIVSANTNIFPASFPSSVSGQFASHYRQRQIDDLLRAREGWKPEEMLVVQKDVYSGLALFLTREAMEAVRRKGGAGPAREAVTLLQGWNGQMEKETPQPVVAQILFQQLRRRLGEKAHKEKGAEYRTEISAAVVEEMLRSRPPGWFEDWDAMLVDALADAYDEAKRKYGRNAQNWDYGAVNMVHLRHPVLGQIPWIGEYFNLPEARMSGWTYTVKQTTPKLGPSMRSVLTPGNWDGSLMNVTVGQSEHRLSGHYKDQWEAYYVGKSFPLEFTRVDARSTLLLKPR